jgi:hypothetical protein
MRSAFIIIVTGFCFAPYAAHAQGSIERSGALNASGFADRSFGPTGRSRRAESHELGRFEARLRTRLDCGQLGVEGNLRAEWDNVQDQIRKAFKGIAKNPAQIVQGAAMMSLCYAFPTACAQLRHDMLSVKANLDLKANACRAIDSFIDTQAEKGLKAARARALEDCVTRKTTTVPTMRAFDECLRESGTGLPLRDFSRAFEDAYTTNVQKTLDALVNFAQSPSSYVFLARLLGETLVLPDGRWEADFSKGMQRPSEVAENYLSSGEGYVCGSWLSSRPQNSTERNEQTEALERAAKRHLTARDKDNLRVLDARDRSLACAALGRSLGAVALEGDAAHHRAVLASGLLNNAIPQELRDEYRSRSEASFEALQASLEAAFPPPVDDVRALIDRLARITRARRLAVNETLARNRLPHSTSPADDCVDALGCERSAK